MTCIVGMEFKNGVMIAGDSLGVSGYDIIERKDTKVFKNGKFIIGYTSSFRMAQLLRYSLNCDKQKSSQSDFNFMCTTFINSVRKCLKDGGFLKINNEKEHGGVFLVGYKGKLYKVYDDMQIAINIDNFYACGCGESYALGSIYTSLKNNKIKKYDEKIVKGILKFALESASKFSGGVGGKFNYIKQYNMDDK